MEVIEYDARSLHVQCIITGIFLLVFLLGVAGNSWVFYAVKYHKAVKLDPISVTRISLQQFFTSINPTLFPSQ